MLSPLLLLWLACAPSPKDTATATPDEATLQVPLRWLGGSTLLDWTQAQDGLWWSLSSLGALPQDPGAFLLAEPTAAGGGEVVFWLDLAAVGFPEAALPAVAEAIAELQQDPSVERHGGVDVGRFLMRTLYEPWRYYAITGACAERAGWEAHHLDPPPLATYAVTDSLLTEGDRLIVLNVSPDAVAGIGFRSAELLGALPDDHAGEHEVIDIMPNGQQRFAIYGADDRLRPAADPALSPAGQPGRCMWCHEGGLMIGQPNPPVDGYWTYDQFFEEMAAQLTTLQAHRGQLDSLINFQDYEAHTWGELLVEEYLWPTPARVALEWGIPLEEASRLDLETHLLEEYPSLGPVYRRADVDALLAVREGWQPVPTLESARELHPDDPRLAPADLRDCTP